MQLDATSDAFNVISKSIQIPTFVVPNITKQSITSQINSWQNTFKMYYVEIKGLEYGRR